MALGSTPGGPSSGPAPGGGPVTETQRSHAVAPTGSDHPAWSVVHAWRRDIRLFSSASDAPRSRRPTDVVLLALAVLTVVVLTFPAPGNKADECFHSCNDDFVLGRTLTLLPFD